MFQHVLRRCAAAKPAQTRSLWYQVGYNQDADHVVKTLHRTMQESGVLKQLDQRSAHEKKWQRRIRKKAESEIRDVNRRMGKIVEFCLQKQKQGNL